MGAETLGRGMVAVEVEALGLTHRVKMKLGQKDLKGKSRPARQV